ncbi:MAG: sigma-70 family RNA polymerase sigma factor [Sphingobacteriales bacterium]|nr:MAG: sigma-70 family RNA polymerase sigma factor [Sphingobacteriales bacterium]
MDKRSKYSEDNEILNAIRNGEEGCIENLYTDYYNMLSSLVLNNKGSSDEANDIVQDTVVAFYEKAKTPKFELTCSIKTYLYSVARNLWLKELKRKGKTPMIIDTSKEFLEIEVDDNVEDKEKIEYFIIKAMEHLNTLGGNCKKILTHFYWDNWNMAKIAEEINYTNADNAKTQKAKCMKRLRELCADLKNI